MQHESIIPYRGQVPRLHEIDFVADGARVIGDVEIGAQAHIWFNAVIRGDVCPIRIGELTNVQDNCTLHVTHFTGPLNIGSRVTIGHNAVIHACPIKESALIGMGAVLLDNCVIEPYTLIAVSSLIRPGFTAPSGMLLTEVPAEVKRPLTDAEMRMIDQSPDNYAKYVAA